MSEENKDAEFYAEKKIENLEDEMESMIKDVEGHGTAEWINIWDEWKIWSTRAKLEAKLRKKKERIAKKVRKILDKKYKNTRVYKIKEWGRKKKNKFSIKLSNAKITLKHFLKNLKNRKV